MLDSYCARLDNHSETKKKNNCRFYTYSWMRRGFDEFDFASTESETTFL